MINADIGNTYMTHFIQNNKTKRRGTKTGYIKRPSTETRFTNPYRHRNQSKGKRRRKKKKRDQERKDEKNLKVLRRKAAGVAPMLRFIDRRRLYREMVSFSPKSD